MRLHYFKCRTCNKRTSSVYFVHFKDEFCSKYCWENWRSLSVVMPVHNEEKYLPYSLRSLKFIDGLVDEFIFVIDNCSDNSEYMIKTMFPTSIISHLDTHKRRFLASETFQQGFDLASKDIVLATGGDLVVSRELPGIIRSVFSDPLMGTTCFRYINYDLLSLKMRAKGYYENLYRNMIEKFRKQARHTGFYAFRKKTMNEVGGLRDEPSEYNEWSSRIKESNWLYKYIPSVCAIHLRPGLEKSKQILQGQSRFHLPNYNFVKTLFHSFVHVKPYLIQGYIQEKNSHSLIEKGDQGGRKI